MIVEQIHKQKKWKIGVLSTVNLNHATDAHSTIADTLALSEAVKEAVDFYNKHPKETLILVTADHETGGLLLTDYEYARIKKPYEKTLSPSKTQTQ